jgi:hypothetical protein
MSSNPFVKTTQFARGDTIVNSLAILFLYSAMSFSGNLLSCDIQDALTNNIFVKHFIGFCLLLYLIVIIDPKPFITYKVDEWVTPKLLVVTLIIYSLFLLAGRMKANYAIFVIGIALVYILLDVEKQNKTGVVKEGQVITLQQLTDQKTLISFVQQILWYFMCLMIILGVGAYYLKQRADHPTDFSYVKFLFGTPKCERFKAK